MQTQSKIFIIIGVVVLIFIGYATTSKKPPSDTNIVVSTNNEPDQIEEVTLETLENVQPENTEVETAEALVDQTESIDSGKYLPYDADTVATSDAEHIVLSFSATWCPSCRTLEKDIIANLGDIPAGTEIYKVDYDTNIELRQKYGVTMQHTQVTIDKSGNMLKKWSGGNTLEQFLAQI